MTVQHTPTSAQLDDLELLLLGALDPPSAARLSEALGAAVVDALPGDLRADLERDGVLEVVDPEGFALARWHRDERRWEPLATPAHGPFRRLQVPPAQVRAAHPDAVVVPVAAELGAGAGPALRDLARRGSPVVVLVLAGHGGGLAPQRLVRSVLAATADLRAAGGLEVVTVPLRPAHDASVRAAVLAAYGDRVVELAAESGGESGGEGAEERAPGVVVLFTGLSGSGKSTIARALGDALLERTDRTLTTLDGDVVRRELSSGLGFSPSDRETNVRRIGWVAAEIARHGGIAIASPIAPYAATRASVRAMVEEAGGRFVLVHVATPLEECERRDRKGLYARARRGEVADFTGISAPYETPDDADVVVDTTGLDVEQALAPVLEALAPHVPGLVAASAVEPPLRVLAVCTANICRSPYLQLALQQRLGERAVVTSAGTHGFADHAMDELMAGEAARRGLETGAFRSRPLTRELVEQADLIVTAETRHRQFVLEEHPAAFRRVFSLGQLARGIDELERRGERPPGGRRLLDELGARRPAADASADVADPYRRGPAAAAACAQHIDALVDAVAPALLRD